MEWQRLENSDIMIVRASSLSLRLHLRLRPTLATPMAQPSPPEAGGGAAAANQDQAPSALPKQAERRSTRKGKK